MVPTVPEVAPAMVIRHADVVLAAEPPSVDRPPRLRNRAERSPQTRNRVLGPGSGLREQKTVVPTNEMAALHMFMSNLRAGRVGLSTFDEPQVTARLAPLDAIAIQPVTIEPLESLSPLEGARP